MASTYVLARPQQNEKIRELAFAGDGVRLAGQIDYPTHTKQSTFPLIFILQHAGCNSRRDYDHYASLGIGCGYAVFRWDKRGTGRSGAGGIGSPVMDAISAYETALVQPHIDLDQVIILAQGEGTRMLADNFVQFAQHQPPAGVILASSMLDERDILKIDSRVQIIIGEKDWHHWELYARQSCAAHNGHYHHGADYYVARHANRILMMEQGNKKVFHSGAKRVIRDWLRSS